jgi:beta-lactam-binding protein with PASTA domain
MALLDGKYEITNQKHLADKESQFDAIAPDGQTLRIVLFDLSSSEEEYQFERYRKVLRSLKKQDLAALHEIVSRPGLHYVAWYTNKQGKDAQLTEAISALLKEQEFAYHEVRCFKTTQGQVQVYDLSFEASQEAKLELKPKLEPQSAKPSAKQLPSWLISWGFAFSFSLIAALFFLAYFLRAMNNETVQIPELLGKNINEALSILETLHLNVNAIPVSSTENPGTILDASPKIGTFLRPYYATVELSYALPAEQFALRTVPQLRGQVFSSETQTALEKAGLRLGNVAYMHSNHPRGDIIAQSAEAQTQLEEKTKVDLLVSQGPEVILTLLPDLTGLSLEDALSLVELAGLSPPDVLSQPSSRFAAGTIIAQSIPPYVEIPLGKFENTLRLTVAAGSAAVTNSLPSLIGYSLAEAERVAAGYSLAIKEIDSANLPPGIVSQTPAPNSEANSANITVLLNVYSPPQAIPVPQVSSQIKPPELRAVSYKFFIEQGIPSSQAEVYVQTLDGTEILIAGKRVQGGDTLEGTWSTTSLGTITFKLKLNKNDYGILKVP